MEGNAVTLPEGKVYSFCGIANPEQFNSTLIKAGLGLAGSHDFPDHHQFTSYDIEEINKKAIQLGAKVIVTTEKDLARLTAFHDTFKLPVYSIVWEMNIIKGESELDTLLEKLF